MPPATPCLNQVRNWTSPHALNETFATLTGGRLGVRIDADVAAKMIRESIVPYVSFVELDVGEIVEAQSHARKHSVRGGTVYDCMHWTAARKAGADILTRSISAIFSPCTGKAARKSSVPEANLPPGTFARSVMRPRSASWVISPQIFENFRQNAEGLTTGS